MLYSQCTVERKTKGGKATTVTWLPANFAIKGKVLKFKGDNNEWTDGWVVTQVGELSDRPADWRGLVRQHRKRTGDALPKRRNNED
jgi:hypothetical protein